MGMLDEELQAMDNTHTSAAQPRTHLVFFMIISQCALQSGEGSLIKSDHGVAVVVVVVGGTL